MNNSVSHPCDELLKQWQVVREEANFYFQALLRLNPNTSETLLRRKELNEKVINALILWRAVEDQLQSCYQEYGERN